MKEKEFNKMINNMLSQAEDKEELMKTLSFIATVLGDRDYLTEGSLNKTFIHGRVHIHVNLLKGKH